MSIMLRLLQILFTSLLFFGQFSFSQQSMEWSAYTSMREASRLFVGGDFVWVATSGGVLRFDRTTQLYARFTRLNGLPSNEVSCMTMDEQGDMWFGTRYAGLGRLRKEKDEFDTAISDFKDLEINSLFSHGRDIYVATDRGVSLYSVDREEVKESYRQLGNLLKDTKVNSVKVQNGTIWVGADGGVAWADLDQLNLQDPLSWQSTTSPGLVVDMVFYEGIPFVASSRGVFSINQDTRGASLDFENLDIVALSNYEDTLVGATQSGLFFRRNGVGEWERINSFGVTGVSDIAGEGGVLWVATSSGLRIVGDEKMPSLGDPPANIFYDIETMPNGDLWVASVPKDGYPAFGSYRFDGESWTVHNLKSGLSSEFSTALAVDANGLIWVGNWGRGIDVLDTAGTWRRYNSSNSALRGINDGSFVPISDIERDVEGNMWIADVQSGLVVMESFPSRRQQLVSQEDFGLAPGRDIGKISIGSDGLIWIGTARDGFILFDYGGTPFELGDDSGIVFNTLNYAELTSNRVSDIYSDTSGRIWIGTDNGLNLLKGEYISASGTYSIRSWRVYGIADGLPSNVVTALAEDARGNIWIATENGVAQIGTNETVDFVFNTDNSGLISNRTNSLHFDSQNGLLWIGTSNGLSRFDYSNANNGRREKMGYLFPNPFFVGADVGQMTLGGLPLGADVSIFNVAGQLIRRISGELGETTIVWNGLNEEGYFVASGVYFYFATNGVDNITGSFAVVNQIR